MKKDSPEDYSLGVIASGMEDGTVQFWNPYNIISGNNKKALIGEYCDYHQSKITAIQFNPTITKNTFLATASDDERVQ